jgi:membrane-bound inhibitor of C-type lysozyme
LFINRRKIVKFNTRIIAPATLVATFLLCLNVTAVAQTAPPAIDTSNLKDTKIALTSTDEDDFIPDTNGSATNEYKCELNDTLTIYSLKDDDNRAALRWKNKLYGLKRVATTTGADRFENRKAGLVWIGIPTKGMLLDSIRGQQLTNDCVTGSR